MAPILSLEDTATWPSDLISYLNSQHDVFHGWEQMRDGKASTVAAPAFDRAVYGLCDVLAGYALIGWHCTRLTLAEMDSITVDGMALPNANLLRERIDRLLEAGLVKTEIRDKLRARNQADDDNRAGMIWFCFFPPHIAGESGIERFLRSWGGEALYNSHERDPETGPILGSIGMPCLVEAEVPIEALKAVSSLAMKIARRFLVSRGYRTREPVDHEDRAIRPLPAENVRRIVRFPDPDFVALTKCDQWRNPISAEK